MRGSIKSQLEWAWKHGIHATARKCKQCDTLAAMVPVQYFCCKECEEEFRKRPDKSKAELERENESLLEQIEELFKKIAKLEEVIDKNKW